VAAEYLWRVLEGNNMKLVLYSDQSIEANKKIDIELLKLINKEKPHIGYIASGSDITRTYFNPKVEYYQNLGVDNILYFDLDVEFDEAKIEDLARWRCKMLGENPCKYSAFLSRAMLIVRLCIFKT
jgi:hypothetical protein